MIRRCLQKYLERVTKRKKSVKVLTDNAVFDLNQKTNFLLHIGKVWYHEIQRSDVLNLNGKDVFWKHRNYSFAWIWWKSYGVTRR